MKSNDVDTDEIQKALALKRHEQPSPRFFNSFSHEVLDRLNSPEPEGPLNWRDRLGLGEDLKPVLLCGLGIFACAILMFCLALSLTLEKPEAPLGTDHAAGLMELAPSPDGSSTGTAAGLPGFQSLGGSNGSTAPVLVPVSNGDSLVSTNLLRNR